MQLRQIVCAFPVAAFLALGLSAVSGQTFDSSQNGLLKGSYRFRHVAVQNVDEFYNPTQVTASYGTITFNGAGSYTISGFTVDNTISGGAPQPLSVTATYSIGSSGAGYIANPLYPGTDSNLYIYGAVSQGVYTGSTTEAGNEGYILNDIFIAIPVASAPTNAGFTSAYQTGLLDFESAGSTDINNALFQLTPNGKGGFGTITLNGQASNQSASTLTQTISGATYNFNSDGSATLTIPLPTGVTSANALLTGTKTIFESADSNFILGWTAGGYDIIFGVKALAVTGTNALTTGLYFTTALEDSSGSNGTDSYYGAINNSGDSNGDGIVHERFSLPFATSFDYGTDDQISVTATGATGTDLNGYNYILGDGGQAFVAIGTNGNYSLQVGLHAASFSGSGVYLNPIGVTNAASFAPVTASIAPGELLQLTGTGLASSPIVTQGGSAFPLTLGGVSVTIDSIACPIYYVSSTQVAVIVPYGVASNQTGLANIQITNNKVASNIVQVYLTDAAPGSFSQSVNGIGMAAARHAATGQAITASNPVQPGEYISLYMTGLGTVTPTISDGAVASGTTLSWADVYNAGNLAVNFNDYQNGTSGNQGTIQFAGLTPTLAGLYQINVQVPSSGLVAGDSVYVEFITDAADVNQIQVPYGTSTGRLPAATVRARAAARAQRKRSVPVDVRR